MAQALTRIPKKGSLDYPLNRNPKQPPWTVYQNLQGINSRILAGELAGWEVMPEQGDTDEIR